MTNAQIIAIESQKLAKEGKIKYTGREFKMVDAEGKEIVFKETEALHTFAAWKALGFKVKKGSKAVAAFPIWKHVKNSKVDESGDTQDEEKMFMKMAHFFTRGQVDKDE